RSSTHPPLIQAPPAHIAAQALPQPQYTDYTPNLQQQQVQLHSPGTPMHLEDSRLLAVFASQSSSPPRSPSPRPAVRSASLRPQSIHSLARRGSPMRFLPAAADEGVFATLELGPNSSGFPCAMVRADIRGLRPAQQPPPIQMRRTHSSSHHASPRHPGALPPH
ncbi:hypothetical protein CVT25_003328, partial [Psilocybe cyanescens]